MSENNLENENMNDEPEVKSESTTPVDKLDASAKKPEAVVVSKAVNSEKTKEQKPSSGGFSTWIKEIRAEFNKIVWPNRKELGKMTLTVVITSLFFGALIAGMDTVFRSAVGFLVNLM